MPNDLDKCIENGGKCSHVFYQSQRHSRFWLGLLMLKIKGRCFHVALKAHWVE